MNGVDARMSNSVVVIGAGTGGPQALVEILKRLPATFPASIIVVQQMRAGFTKILTNQLNEICRLPVYEPIDGQQLHPSEILVVPGGTALSLSFQDDLYTSIVHINDITDTPEKLRARTDTTMSSVAALYGRDAIGVLLTGMGEDGRDGLRAIADAGGITLAQDEGSCIVFDLPSSAIDGGTAQEVLPLWNVADRIESIVTGELNADAA